MSFNLQWYQNGSPVTSDVYFPVSFPSTVSQVITLVVTSPAVQLGIQEILTNVNFYLDGPDADLLISWTTLSSKSNLNGGVEVSFDGGRTWTRFSTTAGYKSNSSTWITLPSSAIGSLGSTGVLNPFDSATILLRVVVPPSFTNYRILTFNLGVDFDVI